MNALIIEDDPTVADVYKTELQAEGFSVDSTRSGRAGLESIRRKSPDVVILDLILPELSGLEVLRAIRSSPLSCNVPVVVVSEAYASDIVQNARQAGATEVLTKASCTPRQVVEVVRHLTQGSSSAPNAPGELAVSARSAPMPAASAADAQFQAELREECLTTGTAAVQAIQSSFQLYSKDLNDAAVLHNLYRKVHSMTGNTGLARLNNISVVASAFESLLRETIDRHDRVNNSVLRTMAQAIDLLATLYKKPPAAKDDIVPRSKAIAVDDDPIALRAVAYSLEKVDLQPISVGNPSAALKQIQEQQFDLVVTDLEMPGMTGIDLCAQIRRLPNYKLTPILFVTTASDYDHRVQACLSGGTDLIAKPFLFSELGLKALTIVSKRRIAAS